jgi:hypothetical protein
MTIPFLNIFNSEMKHQLERGNFSGAADLAELAGQMATSSKYVRRARLAIRWRQCARCGKQ